MVWASACQGCQLVPPLLTTSIATQSMTATKNAKTRQRVCGAMTMAACSMVSERSLLRLISGAAALMCWAKAKSSSCVAMGLSSESEMMLVTKAALMSSVRRVAGDATTGAVAESK